MPRLLNSTRVSPCLQP